MNHVFLVGRAVADCKLHYSGSGKAVTRFGLAVARWRSPQKGTGATADFVDVVAFDRLAEVVTPYLARGRLVGVNGRLTTRSYERAGTRRKVVEVIADSIRFLDKPPQREEKVEG